MLYLYIAKSAIGLANLTALSYLLLTQTSSQLHRQLYSYMYNKSGKGRVSAQPVSHTSECNCFIHTCTSWVLVVRVVHEYGLYHNCPGLPIVQSATYLSIQLPYSHMYKFSKDVHQHNLPVTKLPRVTNITQTATYQATTT